MSAAIVENGHIAAVGEMEEHWVRILVADHLV